MTPPSLEEFAVAHERLTVEYLAQQEALRCIPPAWRFAAGDARVTYWGLPGAAAPLMVDAIVDDAAGHATALLATSLADLGLDAIDYFATRPVGGLRSPRTEPETLEQLGFGLVASQVRLEHTGNVTTAASLDDVRLVGAADDELLRELIATASAHSLDRATRDEDPTAGLASMRTLVHEPEWWTVAHDAIGACGFVLPALTADGGAVIGFIGVVPRARGRGLGAVLLAQGTRALKTVADRVVADVDADNAPMLRAAAAVGYAPFAVRAHYRRGHS